MKSFAVAKGIKVFVLALGITGAVSFNAMAQYGGGGGGGTGGGSGGGSTGGTGGGTSGGGYGGGLATAGYGFHGNYHIGFDRPEAWGLKYFTSISLLNGLQPPESEEGGHHPGSISVGFEADWIPTLSAEQSRIGFYGKAPEDLNKAPFFGRVVVRVGLPAKFSAVVALPPPFEMFGVTPHLVAFGVERPLLERDRWVVNWRGYGQLGSVKGAYTCPKSVLGFGPGSAQNPTACVGESNDEATLRYAGSEFQLAYRIRSMPKLIPHVSVAGNFIDGAFQVHAPVTGGLDQTRMWTRGGTFSTTGGVTYFITKQAAFTVDAFYSPLWVQRSPGAPSTNDGLFNVRALLSYNFR